MVLLSIHTTFIYIKKLLTLFNYIDIFFVIKYLTIKICGDKLKQDGLNMLKWLDLNRLIQEYRLP